MYESDGYTLMEDSERYYKMVEAAEMLWGVVANVSGGDWTLQSEEWQKAAARWRDNYFNLLQKREP